MRCVGEHVIVTDTNSPSRRITIWRAVQHPLGVAVLGKAVSLLALIGGGSLIFIQFAFATPRHQQAVEGQVELVEADIAGR